MKEKNWKEFKSVDDITLQDDEICWIKKKDGSEHIALFNYFIECFWLGKVKMMAPLSFCIPCDLGDIAAYSKYIPDDFKSA